MRESRRRGAEVTGPDIEATPQTRLEQAFAQRTRFVKAPATTRLADSLGVLPVEVWLQRADDLMREGNPGLARDILHAASQRWPKRIDLRYQLGSCERLLGNGTTAEALLRSVLHEEPDHEHATLTLAIIYRDRGRMNAATDLVRRLFQLKPDRAPAGYIANFLMECRRTRDAHEVCEAALRVGASESELLLLAGVTGLMLGEYGIARERLIRALQGTPPQSGALLPLALCQRYDSAEHPDFDRFKATLESADARDEAAIIAGFALGKACDDVGDFAGAATVLRAANRAVHRQVAWKPTVWHRFVWETLQAKALPAIKPGVHSDFTPVFIIGLPRTGTTLLAELLGRHTQVCVRGELNWLEFIGRRLQSTGAPNHPQQLQRSAELYLAQLRQDDAPARWYIDKNPLNFRQLPLIAALFPQARVIHCVRDRRDTALSIWSQHFDHEDNGYAYDFQDIAAFAAGHDRLIEHARSALSLSIHEVRYEALVADPGAVVSDALSFLGIRDFDPINAPARRDQDIGTASVWQARQPVYSRSVGRWQTYAPYVPELLGALSL